MTNLQALRKRYVQLCDAEEYEVASGMKEAIDLVEGHLHGPRLTYKVTQEPDGSELIEYPWDTHTKKMILLRNAEHRHQFRDLLEAAGYTKEVS